MSPGYAIIPQAIVLIFQSPLLDHNKHVTCVAPCLEKPFTSILVIALTPFPNPRPTSCTPYRTILPTPVFCLHCSLLVQRICCARDTRVLVSVVGKCLNFLESLGTSEDAVSRWRCFIDNQMITVVGKRSPIKAACWWPPSL